MSDDAEFAMTYLCYFLYTDGGGLQCNTVDGKTCLCLFTSRANVQAFKQSLNLFMHGPDHVDLQVAVDECPDYYGLINRLKSGEADMAADNIHHLVIDPVPGRPVLYTTIKNFIEDLPLDNA